MAATATTGPRVKVCVGCDRTFTLRPDQPSVTKRCPPCMEAHRVRQCPVCGETYRLRENQTDRKTCSFRCNGRSAANLAKLTARNAARRRPPKPCPVCGVPFIPTGRNWQTVHCSTECWRRSDRPFWANGKPLVRASEATDPPPPDEATIALLAAEVRAGWTDEERLERLRCDWRPRHWEVPLVAYGFD